MLTTWVLEWVEEDLIHLVVGDNNLHFTLKEVFLVVAFLVVDLVVFIFNLIEVFPSVPPWGRRSQRTDPLFRKKH